MLAARGRHREAQCCSGYAPPSQRSSTTSSSALRAYFNLADTLGQIDRHEEAEAVVRDGLAFAGRVGNAGSGSSGAKSSLYALGEWDELLASLSQLLEEKWAETSRRSACSSRWLPV